MKTKVTLLATVALLASLLLAACGGDDGGEGEIRTQQGLGVAALATNAGLEGGEMDGRGDDAGLPLGAPVPLADIGLERSGAIAPDIAPVPFPALQQSQTGVTVQGFGSASVDADGAVLELYFSAGVAFDSIPEPAPRRGESEPGFGEDVAPSPPEVEPLPEGQEISEADLQPVVDAIVAQGVSSDDVEVTIDPVYYYDPYYGGSATVRVTVPSVGDLDGIVDAATEAASGLGDISFNGSNVSFTVDDCAALEQAAMRAAVDDARQRGQTFATALGVGLGSVSGAYHYSYSLFGGSPCDFDSGGIYALGGVSYAEGQSTEVQLIATVTITFAIQ